MRQHGLGQAGNRRSHQWQQQPSNRNSAYSAYSSYAESYEIEDLQHQRQQQPQQPGQQHQTEPNFNFGLAPNSAMPISPSPARPSSPRDFDQQHQQAPHDGYGYGAEVYGNSGWGAVPTTPGPTGSGHTTPAPPYSNAPGSRYSSGFMSDTAVESPASTPAVSLRNGVSDPALGDRGTPQSWLNPPRNTPSQLGHYSQYSVGQSTPTMHQSTVSLTGLLPQPAAGMLSNDWVKPGQIARLHDRDDADIWKGWKRIVFKFVPLMTFINTGLYLTYLGYRIYCVVDAQKTQKTVYIAAWVFVGIEVIAGIPPLLHNIWTTRSLKKRHRPKLRLTGNDAPTVDVFITCCGEDDDVVLDTVRAACDQDYPAGRFRVIILDDAKSAGLEQGAKALSATYPYLFYMARTKIPGKPHHFKSGNLNYGLDEVHKLPGGAGVFMAALDADMIPEREWLSAVVPHLLVDPRMGLACPPQLFYNTPPADPLAQSLDFFVHVVEPIKDALGVAWCTGSGYVARREALDEIGNFPLGSLAEDVATSTLMLGRGWHTAFVHEPLQFGTVPEDFASHLKQRTRWSIGTVDNAFKMRFSLWGDQVKQLTAAQRFSGFLYAILNFYSILMTISLFAIPIILAWGKPLVAYSSMNQLRWLMRACFAATICNRITEYVLSVPAGYNNGQRSSRYQMWMAPYISLCLIRSFVLPKWLGGQAQAFKPTGSLGSALNERDPVKRKGMFRRLWGILFGHLAAFHFVYVYFTIVAACVTSFRCVVINEGNTKNVLLCLLTHAFWPPLTFIFICNAMWTPISYAIDPPDMPDREQLLVRDPKTGVAHPTEKSKKIAFGMQDA